MKPLITALRQSVPGPGCDRIARTLGNIGDPRAADALFQAAVFGSEVAAESLAAMKDPRAGEAAARAKSAKAANSERVMSLAARHGAGEGTLEDLIWVLSNAGGFARRGGSLERIFYDAKTRWRSEGRALGDDEAVLMRRAGELCEKHRYWSPTMILELEHPGECGFERSGRMLRRADNHLHLGALGRYSLLRAVDRVPRAADDLVLVVHQRKAQRGPAAGYDVHMVLLRERGSTLMSVARTAWVCAEGFLRAIGFSWEDIDGDDRPEAFVHSECQQERRPGSASYYLTALRVGCDRLKMVFGEHGSGPFVLNDLDGDGRREIISTQTDSADDGILVWADVYQWRGGAYQQANSEFPSVYRELALGLERAVRAPQLVGQRAQRAELLDYLGRCYAMCEGEEEP